MDGAMTGVLIAVIVVIVVAVILLALGLCRIAAIADERAEADHERMSTAAPEPEED